MVRYGRDFWSDPVWVELQISKVVAIKTVGAGFADRHRTILLDNRLVFRGGNGVLFGADC